MRVCEQFTIDGIVCPPKLRSKLFTTAAVDNIDHNPSSATAKSSFQGTGIFHLFTIHLMNLKDTTVICWSLIRHLHLHPYLGLLLLCQ